jgi:hypothetical protein
LTEDKKINLRLKEEKDSIFLTKLWEKGGFGEYESILHLLLKTEIEKRPGGSQFDTVTDRTLFVIERPKDDRWEPVGFITHFLAQPYNLMSLFFAISNDENIRRQGYGKQAVIELTDRLFENKDIARVQATVNENDKVAQKVLERAGYQKEAKLRKAAYVKGKWSNQYLYSILKDEWKKKYPKIRNQ